jgi:hypothetical protein
VENVLDDSGKSRKKLDTTQKEHWNFLQSIGQLTEEAKKPDRKSSNSWHITIPSVCKTFPALWESAIAK